MFRGNGNSKVSRTNQRNNGLTWVGARDTCVSKKSQSFGLPPLMGKKQPSTGTDLPEKCCRASWTIFQHIHVLPQSWAHELNPPSVQHHRPAQSRWYSLQSNITFPWWIQTRVWDCTRTHTSPPLTSPLLLLLLNSPSTSQPRTCWVADGLDVLARWQPTWCPVEAARLWRGWRLRQWWRQLWPKSRATVKTSSDRLQQLFFLSFE